MKSSRSAAESSQDRDGRRRTLWATARLFAAPGDIEMAVDETDSWPAVLAALQTNPRDARELLARLRTDREFAAVSGDDTDAAPIMLRAAEAELGDAFADPWPLRDSPAVAFVIDHYEWIIGGALRANPEWPAHEDGTTGIPRSRCSTGPRAMWSGAGRHGAGNRHPRPGLPLCASACALRDSRESFASGVGGTRQRRPSAVARRPASGVTMRRRNVVHGRRRHQAIE